MDDPPRIIRPIPRRPFHLDVADSSEPTTPLQQHLQPSPLHSQATLPPASAFARLLGPTYNGGGSDGIASPPAMTPSLSRNQSVVNLGSTLFGIFSQVPSSTHALASDSPWGTGAQTPVRRPGLDEGTLELIRKRANSASVPALSAVKPVNIDIEPDERRPKTNPSWMTQILSSLSVRATLLLLLGTGYGLLVMRLHDAQRRLIHFADPSALPPSPPPQPFTYSPTYLAFWGALGVLLGFLLPWFDAVWDSTFGSKKPAPMPTDWALVVRGIGAFAGITFAIRRLPWTSTLQASLVLALTNPFLWYIVDRSQPGFVLSAAVGLVGTIVLLGTIPAAIPAMAPSIVPSAAAPTSAFGYDSSKSNASFYGPVDVDGGALILGGLARRDTVVMGIWMASVLFCSCVCFGNIGRRLALRR